MPIYEYQCSACGHQLEVMQKMSAEALTECPSCHKSALVKLVSAAGFQLKGTGWYATDFRNKPPGNTKPEKTSKTATEKTQDKGNNSSSSSSSTSSET